MRKSFIKAIALLCALPILFYTTVAFTDFKREADFKLDTISGEHNLDRNRIFHSGIINSGFQSSIDFSKAAGSACEGKEFYGQQLLLENHPQIDKILIGITSNHIARAEVWKDDELLIEREKGFLGKMTWGATQQMHLKFSNSTDRRSQCENSISFRFNEYNGVFGDIAALSVDLSEFDPIEGELSFALFAKGLECSESATPTFSNYRFWASAFN